MRKFILIVALLFAFTAPIAAQDVTPDPTFGDVDITGTEVPTETPVPDEIEIITEPDGGIDVTAPIDTADYPVIDPAAIVATIVNTVSGLVLAAFGSAPVTVVIVALLKKIKAFDIISAPTMTFAVASVLYIGAIIANVTGYTLQFENFLEMVATVAPAIVSFMATLLGAPKIFNAASRNRVAFIGDSRTPPITFVSDGNTVYAVQADIPSAQVN